MQGNPLGLRLSKIFLKPTRVLVLGTSAKVSNER